MNNYSNNAQFEYSRRLNEYVSNYGEASEVVEAVLFAQAVELQLLKAPQTAVFADMQQFNVQGGNGVYTVSGHVDSQNSYGASIRTPFTLHVSKVNGIWSTTDKFVSTSAQINASIFGNTILWWILGIAGSLITYFVISSQIGI